ncbi:MAG: hypothetical protein JWP85_486 [Rhodoglobus sp.]|nr:hypothetical protein [Rhodoglobus sp.]
MSDPKNIGSSTEADERDLIDQRTDADSGALATDPEGPGIDDAREEATPVEDYPTQSEIDASNTES